MVCPTKFGAHICWSPPTTKWLRRWQAGVRGACVLPSMRYGGHHRSGGRFARQEGVKLFFCRIRGPGQVTGRIDQTDVVSSKLAGAASARRPPVPLPGGECHGDTCDVPG